MKNSVCVTIIIQLKNHIKKIYKNVKDELRHLFKIYDSEKKLASDNQNYWNRDYSEKIILAQDAHWKNNGIFEDEQRWLSIGKEHLDLILNYSSILNLKFPLQQIVEWGCGGGANAIHFAPLTEKFIGIDITQESLQECKIQMESTGFSNFQPILINATTPELILNEEIKNSDLFICTYVYEQFPSPAYGLKVLSFANKLLRNEGVAFIHIRYHDGNKELKPKRWGYFHHPYIMTTYTLEEFWQKSIEFGFEPLCIYLTPLQPLVNDKSTAYYFLKKRIEC